VRAVVKVSANTRARIAQSARLTVSIKPRNFNGRSYVYRTPIQLKAGTNALSAHFYIGKPALWQPADHGFPALYDVTLTLSDAQGEMDRAVQSIGVRHITFDALRSCWTINGHRLFLRGTNYISSSWLSTMTPAAYARDLEMMRAAHINAIRVQAHVEGQAFYNEADAKGILIWQDFPLQWGYDDSVSFAQEAARQAHAMLGILSIHPSIMAWSGQNEPPWDANWMRFKYPDWQPEQNRLLSRKVGDALPEDTTRYVTAASLTAQHMWQGWYWGSVKDWMIAVQEPNITEFGAQALPDIATLEQIIRSPNRWPKTTNENDRGWDEWEYHNFQRHETFDVVGMDRGPTLATFIEHSQLYQAHLLQIAIENLRRQRYQPVASIFQFMFVENWPSINWGVVDYLRRPKAGYDALRRAYQPILPSIAWSRDHYQAGESFRAMLWAINDTWRHYRAVKLVWRISNRNTTVASDTTRLVLPADSGRPIVEAYIAQLSPGAYTLEAKLVTLDGHTLGENTMTFDVEAKS